MGIRRLKDLQDAIKQSLEQCGKHVDSFLNTHPYTREEILKELEATDEEIRLHSLNFNTQESREHLNM